MFLSKFRSSLAAALTSVAIFSCTPAPAIAKPVDTSVEDFCSTATEYNLNWHKLLQQGAPVEQIVQWHVEVLKSQPDQIPDVLVSVVNKMLYLTVLNRETEPEVTKEGLQEFCNGEVNKLRQSKHNSKNRVML